MTGASLLLEVGIPFRRGASGLLVEAQALNGLRLWLQHFDSVTLCATVMPEGAEGSTIVWSDPSPLLATGRLAFEPLPWGYRIDRHFRHAASVRRRYQALVAGHRYLCFANIGGFGAWGNLAAAEARRQGCPYSLWFDWVVHAMDSASRRGFGPGAWKRSLEARVAARSTRAAIEGAALGLFHGLTVYEAYAPWCRQPELVHDIHVAPDDAIDDAALAAKLEGAAPAPLRLGYVGRVHPMKAPFDWIDAVAAAAATLGPGRIEATWLGDGPLLTPARERVRALGLEASIRFPGFVSDRAAILAFLREQHAMPFCHVTPESPRCLIEALLSATPLVGYDSAYARELTGNRGGAILSPVGDVQALAANLVRVADPAVRRGLIEEAATSRPIYNDEAVFAHRSELIKRYL